MMAQQQLVSRAGHIFPQPVQIRGAGEPSDPDPLPKSITVIQKNRPCLPDHLTVLVCVITFMVSRAVKHLGDFGCLSEKTVAVLRVDISGELFRRMLHIRIEGVFDPGKPPDEDPGKYAHITFIGILTLLLIAVADVPLQDIPGGADHIRLLPGQNLQHILRIVLMQVRDQSDLHRRCSLLPDPVFCCYDRLTGIFVLFGHMSLPVFDSSFFYFSIRFSIEHPRTLEIRKSVSALALLIFFLRCSYI